MDAITRNRCEAELLAIAYELISVLDLKITLEAEADAEGGLRNIWKIIGENDKQIMCVLTLLLLIATLFPSKDEELVGLQKEDTKLSIEERKLKIEKLKREIGTDTTTEDTLKSAASAINHNHKIVVHKSSFYKKLNFYDKVTEIGFSQKDQNNKPVGDELRVARADFSRFIMLSNKLPVETIEDAQIEIVAPVLRGKRSKWKGILFDSTAISFELNDNLFKEAVLAKQIGFKNGDVMECVLEIHREVNEVGEVVITKYSVPTVLRKLENGVRIETESGKLYRQEQEFKKSQTSLDI
jgi:hypothetical protein